MNHKRRRPKHQRAGCLMCKPWKDPRGKTRQNQEKHSVRRRMIEPEEFMPSSLR